MTRGRDPIRAEAYPDTMTDAGLFNPSDGSECSDGEKRNRRDDWTAIANFHPGWFAVTMGTGIVAILLEDLPYKFAGLHYTAIVIFVLNLVLFTLFLVISIVRYVLWPEKFRQMLMHPYHSMLLGTFPMGFSTIVTLTAVICVPAWGPWAATMAWIMWWIDAVVSVAICLYVPFLLTTIHPVTLETMTASWLLPVVAPIVSAAAGAVVAEVLPDPRNAVITIIVAYIMAGIGVPFAILIMVIYFHRLTLHKLVTRAEIVSTMLPVGPLGQASFVSMQLGIVARDVFPKLDILSPIGGEVFHATGILLALVTWGFALLWLWFAFASFVRGPFPFNLGWWAFTFPLGVFATATNLFGRQFGFVFFDILGTVITGAVILLWLMVFSLTVYKSVTREVFKS